MFISSRGWATGLFRAEGKLDGAESRDILNENLFQMLRTLDWARGVLLVGEPLAQSKHTAKTWLGTGAQNFLKTVFTAKSASKIYKILLSLCYLGGIKCRLMRQIIILNDFSITLQQNKM